MISNKLKLLAIGSTSAVSTLVLGIAAHAQVTQADVIASSTAGINSAGGTVFAVFFGILPTILLYVVPITLVLWGIYWLLSHFKRGKK